MDILFEHVCQLHFLKEEPRTFYLLCSDREADDVLVRMMDDRSAETDRYLRGHSGPVYSLDFSPDKLMLLSSSEDTSIRLWSLLTWTCLVVYKGHLFPVWKVVFSPHGGYYFASAGHDRTARYTLFILIRHVTHESDVVLSPKYRLMALVFCFSDSGQPIHRSPSEFLQVSSSQL